MHIVATLITASLLAILAGPVRAAGPDLADVAGRYAISDKGSDMAFTVAKIGGGGLAGRFTRFSGDIAIDARDIAHSRVTITIVPDSVAAGEPRIDAFLKSDAVFDAAHEDAISFRSRTVTRTGADTASIDGALTARGRTRPATFEVRMDGSGANWIGFHVTGTLLRSLYGMDVGTPIYSNVVAFDMRLKAMKR